MAGPAISAAVGQGGTNHLADVKTVQSLLNGFVASGQIGETTVLPIDGDWVKTVPYIEKFQKNVAGLSSPDGRIDKNGTTWKALIKEPHGPVQVMLATAMALKNMALGPVELIPSDLWLAAMMALIKHSGHQGLVRPEIVTLMDFRISRNQPRLWTVDLETRSLFLKTWVAHGTNSGKSSIPTTFGDGDRKTSLGAYCTRDDYNSSTLGHVEKAEPALRLTGLEPGINGRAKERGILFHAATYVNPPKAVGNSWGCFATPIADNKKLVPAIADGTFVYAYAG